MKRTGLLSSLLLLVAVAAFAGAGKEAALEGPALNKPGELPIVLGPYTLSVMTHEGYGYRMKPSKDIPVYGEVEKLTGVTIDWQTAPTDTIGEVINTRFAAGTGLPALMNTFKSSADLEPYYESGLIIEITDDMLKKLPLLQKMYTEYPDAKVTSMTSTGKLIGLPDSIMYTKEWQVELQINDPWMKKLGLKDPTTTDEFYNVLKAFKTKDPNGNGQADELPFVNLWSSLESFADGWDLNLSGIGLYGFQVGKNNKISIDFIDSRMKDYFTYLHKLYAEGLLDKDFPNNSMDMMAKKVANNQVGSFAEWSSFSEQYDKLLSPTYDLSEDTSKVIFKIIKQPVAGSQFTGQRFMRYRTGGNWVVTRDAKRPDIALRFHEAVLLHPKLDELHTWGIEGKTFTKENGQYKSIVDVMVLVKMGGSEWALPNKQSFWDERSGPKKVYDRLNGRANVTKTPFPQIPRTAEENDKVKQYSTDVNTYFSEMRVKFITGDADIGSTWDTYVAEMKKRGVDELAKVYQGIYDRYLAIPRKK